MIRRLNSLSLIFVKDHESLGKEKRIFRKIYLKKHTDVLIMAVFYENLDHLFLDYHCPRRLEECNRDMGSTCQRKHNSQIPENSLRVSPGLLH